VSEPRIAGDPADDPWFTVNFIPATESYFLHLLNQQGTGTWTQRVVGWLVQHRHGETIPITDERSRVIAGIFEPGTGQVGPVNCDSPQFVGVYPASESPSPEEVAGQREARGRRRRPDPAT
jgi:hypothetical protein